MPVKHLFPKPAILTFKTPGLNAQSLIQNLQSQLDTDGELRASLSGDLQAIEAGSNTHLEQLLDVVSEIEDNINTLLCDLETAKSAMEIYAIAGSTCQRGEFHLSSVVAVLSKLLPDHIDWDRCLHQQFHRLHTMKRGLAHH